MNRRQIFSIHIVLKCQRSSEAQTYARAQYFCTFVIEIKDRMQYCMEEPKRGCRARALSNGTRWLYALRAALRAAGGRYYIKWVEIDRKCNKLTDSMHGILKRLASLWVLTNKTCLHQRKPSATFRSHVLRGQFALPNPTGTGKDGMNHYCHLGTHEIYGDKTTGNDLWLVTSN